MSAAGPPQGASAPLGGSDDTQCGAWGHDPSAAGPPQGASAPLGGSDDTKCGAWGHHFTN